MDGVVDGVQVQLLGLLGQLELTQGSAVLGVHTHLQVLLGGVGQDLAQQLSKLGGVLGLLQSGPAPVLADLREALAVSHTGHRQVHTDLGALADKVLTQTLEDLLGSALRHTDHVLSSPGALSGLLHKLLLGGLTDGAELRSGLTLVNITTDRTNKLLHANKSSSCILFCIHFWHLP